MERNERYMNRMENRENRSSMQKYLVLIKVDTTKTLDFLNSISALSHMPAEGVMLDASYNVFGNWDFAVWFEANTNEDAVHFVGEQIRSIKGVTETVTMPATPVKEYPMKM